MDKKQRLIDCWQKLGIGLDAEELEALDRCFGKKGPYKGYLTKTSPNSVKYPLANAIYNAITPNGYKRQIFNMMMMGDRERATYTKLSKYRYPAALDKDREALQSWGAW